MFSSAQESPEVMSICLLGPVHRNPPERGHWKMVYLHRIVLSCVCSKSGTTWRCSIDTPNILSTCDFAQIWYALGFSDKICALPPSKTAASIPFSKSQKYRSKVGTSSQPCDRSGHLQNGKPARRKNPGHMGKKMENGPRPEMFKEWPPKWKKWPKSHFGVHLSISAAIFWLFRAWGHFSFSFPFSRDFLHRAGSPFCKWLLRSQSQPYITSNLISHRAPNHLTLTLPYYS